ncbi:MAG: Glycosyltransferase [candidate division WWE3 bacterium GW2011_GWC1_47_10]|uniref:Glycosyltransferase n=1 Tax=candidate division WWE3 bacterium GW2011_GWC1_47_10 TaxID=1619122 RepID=A0A0G1TAP6_UNCKA|nr:MAG: Glycosyltransferase [candidate division WWE3 bacterium GW2011_GWC1_47_10]
MKLSVVIPVYNEKGTVATIVDRVEGVAGVDKEIIIVDDGSTDGTRDVLKEIAANRSHVKVILKEANCGKGASLREGFRHATGDYVIVQDADLEYDPQEYTKLIEALGDGKTRVVYGSRFSGNYEDMSNLHYWGNKFLTLVTNVLYGVLLTDMETCYKLLPGSFVRNLKIESNRFNFEPEITAKILKSGLKLREVPISYKGRTHGEGKKITWKDGLSAVYTLIKFRFVD